MEGLAEMEASMEETSFMIWVACGDGGVSWGWGDGGWGLGTHLGEGDGLC